MTDVLANKVVTWNSVCAFGDLIPDRGRAALFGEVQVALFRLTDGSLYAVSNYDPFSGTYVMSRGIVGSKGDAPKVASPIYKQSFDLRTGVCLDDETISIMTFPVRVVNGRIEVGLE